ncbi:APC family permease [Nonomuraea sp. K274]|uniref:APC family permease n=1 Tax=Nonomuraea cypriaca TaxID=1187855 RepID=A0A931F383_9ACTN|nr:APC family permease [Nonomuraea cypriaca]MBF8189876.1 APC family permease [Nonomuraea cypriaca]
MVEFIKRLAVGRALRSERQREQLLPKRLALPIFASDPLSSVAYATQEILLVLTLAGLTYLRLASWVAAAVVALLVVVVVSYRQVVNAYPGGGGSYAVASANLGPSAGLVVAAALLVDYVMTVAVSIASGVDNIISAFPVLHEHRVGLAVGFVALLATMNLRGVRESGLVFAVPTYLFVAAVLSMCAIGLVRGIAGHPPVAESAAHGIRPEAGYEQLTVLALLALLLRAFSSGCTALTGVEAISNGVPAFRRPKARNAAATLAVMGLIAVTMFAGVTALALIAGVRITSDPCRLTDGVRDCVGEPQRTVIAQVAAAVFGGHLTFGFFLVQTVTALVLVLAANTAFNGFPLLASVLARHRYLPQQLHTRGDRLAFSNGILALAAVAGVLLWAFQASVTNLIHLYILGVFTSFTLSQTGMVRHWNALLNTETDPVVRRRHRMARAINTVGATATGLVLAIVLATKFTEGAYLAVAAGALLWLMMRGIRRHYDAVTGELTVTDPAAQAAAPSHILTMVVVSRIDVPTLHALGYARVFGPVHLEAVTVAIDRKDTQALVAEWDARGLDVPLRVLDSPYREVTRPVTTYVRSLPRRSTRDVVNVVIPEYIVGRRWENLLHNRTTRWLKSRLTLIEGVVVISVPWQLSSSRKLVRRPVGRAPGAVRRGEPV